MAEVYNISGVQPSLEVQQIFRLIEAFLAIADETARAHLVAVAESLAASGDASMKGVEADHFVADCLQAMVNARKGRH